eukprot:TRINITY_DN51214_c0_g1_i1.p2 TRINITY_DN51214_c0_g1~~TRINITY_DN51214_c0_g1_i1.p2  ORF type:complete len:111 (-),score=30.32 TRINITY_DN51214_c0_g1_i1:118-450(-)
MLYIFFFKQKTAYEMLRSLVGSEMCIRDRYQRRVRGFLLSRDANAERAGIVPDTGQAGVQWDAAQTPCRAQVTAGSGVRWNAGAGARDGPGDQQVPPEPAAGGGLSLIHI